MPDTVKKICEWLEITEETKEDTCAIQAKMAGKLAEEGLALCAEDPMYFLFITVESLTVEIPVYTEDREAFEQNAELFGMSTEAFIGLCIINKLKEAEAIKTFV